MTRIMIVDDHAVVRLGLRNLLSRQPGWAVVAEASTEPEAVQLAEATRPEVIVMDIHLGDGHSGLEACRAILARLPETRIIILTAFAEEALLAEAITAGAAGYVLKQVGSNDLIRAIETVTGGETLGDASTAGRVLTELRETCRPKCFADLTDQELKVLVLIADGKTNREIAHALGLVEGTVRNYVSNILGKLSLSNRAEATAYAVRHQLKDYL
jgi:DNA-binding NarL/FixJ family response regulator